MFAWYKVRLSNEEKAMVVKTHRLSKFTHVAMILEDPPKKLIKEIEEMICRFIQTGNYKTTKELVFLPKEHGGLGIPRLKVFCSAMRVGWMKRTFHIQSFWLRTAILKHLQPTGHTSKVNQKHRQWNPRQNNGHKIQRD